MKFKRVNINLKMKLGDRISILHFQKMLQKTLP